MARKGLIEFITNTKTDGTSVEGSAVTAPAFSITKFMTAASVVVTPIAAAVTEALTNGSMQAVHHTALALGLLGFLALVSSADLFARAIAVRRTESQRTNLLRFSSPLPGQLILDGPDEAVQLLGAVGGAETSFLVKRADDSLEWRPTSEIRLG